MKMSLIPQEDRDYAHEDYMAKERELTALRSKVATLERDNAAKDARIAQLEIDNADLHANLAESNTWLAEANARIAESQQQMPAVYCVRYDGKVVEYSRYDFSNTLHIQNGATIIPLYAAPIIQPTPEEAVADAVRKTRFECAQIYLDNFRHCYTKDEMATWIRGE